MWGGGKRVENYAKEPSAGKLCFGKGLPGDDEKENHVDSPQWVVREWRQWEYRWVLLIETVKF